MRLKQPALRKRPIERFQSKVKETTDCHIWQGAYQRSGTGLFYNGQRVVAAHEAAYELHIGPVPPDAYVCQSCGNRGCVRPDHLFLGSREEHLSLLRSYRAPEKIRRGEQRSGAKLKSEDIKHIRSRYATQGATLQALARKYNVSVGLIHQIVRRKKWAHVE